MTQTQRRWLRLSVLIGVGAATATVFFTIVVYGAFASENYIGALSSAANTTGWGTAEAIFGGSSLFELLIPVTIVAIILIGILIFIVSKCAGLAGCNS